MNLIQNDFFKKKIKVRKTYLISFSFYKGGLGASGVTFRQKVWWTPCYSLSDKGGGQSFGVQDQDAGLVIYWMRRLVLRHRLSQRAGLWRGHGLTLGCFVGRMFQAFQTSIVKGSALGSFLSTSQPALLGGGSLQAPRCYLRWGQMVESGLSGLPGDD